MLYDPKWKLPEVKPKTVREVMFAAADYIDRHGWCKNMLESPEGQVCAMGAIWAVTGRPNIGAPFFESEASDDLLLCERACVTLQAVVDVAGFGIGTWNDQPGQTKDKVTAELRRIANTVGDKPCSTIR
jgi:hypothetical protein